jgi:SAM-dependent methyltransferase
VRPPDDAFADPKQAILYDFFDGDRSDLDLYLSIAEEVDADSIVDIGCGTGSLAVRLAEGGKTVVGVDPAAASLEVARGKTNAERLRWLLGDATVLRDHHATVDLAVMTGNVAQVFISDKDWHETLSSIRSCLRPGGWLVFETRRPEARAWEEWDLPPTEVTLPDGRSAIVSRSVTSVEFPLVSFEGWTEIDGETLWTGSTLRSARLRGGGRARRTGPPRQGTDLRHAGECDSSARRHRRHLGTPRRPRQNGSFATLGVRLVGPLPVEVDELVSHIRVPRTGNGDRTHGTALRLVSG